MFTGWRAFLGRPYVIQRPLEIDEKHSALDRGVRQRVPPYEWGSVLRLNSSYLELVDRRYRLRGMFYTLAGLLVTSILAVATILLIESTARAALGGAMSTGDLAFSIFVGVIPCTLMTIFAWHVMVRYDVFRYTHYPIRFDRRNRVIYVFRAPDEGGILEVPWEEAFFHIGVGANHSFVRDLRAHVLKDGIITDTFTVGHYFDDTQIDRVKSLWEFIRRYMDEGPEAVGPDPLDRYVSTSTNQTLRNCYIHVASSLGAFAYSIRYAIFPIYMLLTLSRWAVFKTCKRPVWPEHIERQCRIAPGDPHQWKEPAFTDEFANDPAVFEHALKRLEPFLRK